mgnify:CR=1 FL=1
MKKSASIKKTEKVAKEKMKGDPGHDWSHVHRVRKLALYIGKKEKVDLFVVELAALLHDIADYKFYKGDEKIGGKIAGEWLRKLKVDEKIIKRITYIIDEIAFRGAKVKYTMETLEGKVVQDADKLDAMGAIGVARTFSYGGHFNVPMYIPEKKPIFHTSFAQYKKNSESTINHFYEKLLLLKDRMHTKSGKKIAIRRHKFMELYLKEFFKEWKL